MNFRLDRKRVFILLRTGRCVNGGGGEWGGKDGCGIVKSWIDWKIYALFKGDDGRFIIYFSEPPVCIRTWQRIARENFLG